MTVPDPTPQVPFSEMSFVERQRLSPVVFAVLCLALIFVLYQVIAGSITFLVMGTVKVTRDNVNVIRSLTMVGQLVFILIPTIILAHMLTRRTSEVFPMRIPSLPESVYAIAGLLFLQQLFQIYLFFQDMIPLPVELAKFVTQFRHTIEEMFRTLVSVETAPELIFVMTVVALVPGIVEELFFRGLIQASFAKRMKPLRAAIIAGIVFGLYHFNPFAVVPLVGLGCYFGILRFRSRSIIMPMTAHFFNNALAVLAVYFSMDDEMILGADKNGNQEIGIVLVQFVVYGLLFVAAFMAYLRSSARRVEMES